MLTDTTGHDDKDDKDPVSQFSDPKLLSSFAEAPSARTDGDGEATVLDRGVCQRRGEGDREAGKGAAGPGHARGPQNGPGW
jgi:hypothetical protein